MDCTVIPLNRQVGQGEIRILQDELMDPIVMGAFFMHPDQGLFLAKEYVLVWIIRVLCLLLENLMPNCASLK
jgi:hypothetical protein